MLQEKQHARFQSRVALVDEDGAAAQQIAVALKHEVDDGVEQLMTRAHKGGQRLTLRSYQGFLECDALVPSQHRFAHADQSISVPYRCRDVGHLIATRFPLLRTAA